MAKKKTPNKNEVNNDSGPEEAVARKPEEDVDP